MIERVTTASGQAADRVRRHEAGAAFEALILGQMLQGLMPEADAASGAATQALARQLAQDSPFGIARLLGAEPR